MYKKLLFALFFIIFTQPSFSHEHENVVTSELFAKVAKNSKVLLTTNMGEILLELYPNEAPLTVDNFLTYVEKKYYDGLIFHRVIRNFMIQAGGFNEDISRMTPFGGNIPNESHNGLKNIKYSMRKLSNPSPMAFSEVFQSLKTGVVDGAENNWPSYESTGHFEVAKYYSLSQHLIIPECVCINDKVYNNLSAKNQKAVKDAARESAELQRALWEKRAISSRDKVMKAGVKFNEIPNKQAFMDAMKPVHTKYLSANPNLVPLVNLIKNTK